MRIDDLQRMADDLCKQAKERGIETMIVILHHPEFKSYGCPIEPEVVYAKTFGDDKKLDQLIEDMPVLCKGRSEYGSVGR